MRRVLSTVLAVALLLGLGALAVLALPNANASLAGVPAVSAQAPEAVPDAPAATENYNLIAMPLNAANQFTSAGKEFKADGLAGMIGAGVSQVLKWDAASQGFLIRYPQFNIGPNFDLEVGGTYFVLLDSNAANVVSFVGDVPAAGTIRFNMSGGAPCKYNAFSVPLDQSSITTAPALGQAIGNAEQLLNWNAQTQEWEIWYPQFNIGAQFAVRIGYPYFACMTANTTWPPQ